MTTIIARMCVEYLRKRQRACADIADNRRLFLDAAKPTRGNYLNWARMQTRTLGRMRRNGRINRFDVF